MIKRKKASITDLDVDLLIKIYIEPSIKLGDIMNMCKTNSMFFDICKYRYFWFKIATEKSDIKKSTIKIYNIAVKRELNTLQFDKFVESIRQKKYDETINYHKELLNIHYFFRVKDIHKNTDDDLLKLYLHNTIKITYEGDLFRQKYITYIPSKNYYLLHKKIETYYDELKQRFHSKLRPNEKSKMRLIYHKNHIVLLYKPMSKKPKNLVDVPIGTEYYKEGYKYMIILL